MNLNERALIVKVYQGHWLGRKTDKEASNRMTSNENASPVSAQVVKNVVARKHLAKITTLRTEIKKTNEKYSLPWLTGGFRILPVKLYQDWRNKIEETKAQYEIAVREFLSFYPSIVESEKNSLGNLYNPKDYPSVSVLESRFSFEILVSPVPDSNDFRVSLDAESVSNLRKELETQVKDQLQDSIKEAWNNLYETVSHITEVLSKTDGKRLHDSMIDNVKELCNVLPSLNLVDDKNLDSMVKEIQKKICSYSVEALRGESTRAIETRNKVKEETEEILKQMESYF